MNITSSTSIFITSGSSPRRVLCEHSRTYELLDTNFSRFTINTSHRLQRDTVLGPWEVAFLIETLIFFFCLSAGSWFQRKDSHHFSWIISALETMTSETTSLKPEVNWFRVEGLGPTKKWIRPTIHFSGRHWIGKSIAW